ncbi:MAG: hypothetical protein K2X99_10390 [Gemmatimonadaceae bacterium]|nr:hypothetical protein [Gemmatimonadaceae bacterium]
MQAITANAEILDEHVANGEGRQALDDIRAVGERARVMVRRLLEVGRSRGPTIAPVGAPEFLARLAPLVTPLLEGRIQYLPTATAQRRLLIDAPRLEHALLNLAVNARDAMPTGGTLAITISDARDSGRVVIAVSDTGSGIPSELHERIFDPFFTTKDATSGSGLGLAMVRRIVAEAGGTLTLQSRVDEGTTFSVSLPATA